MRFVPLLPILIILFIFYNYYYEVSFQRPKNSMVRNMRLVQMLMQVTGDSFEVQYYVLDNFFYWKSKEKTLYTLNLCLLGFFCALPVYIIPLRYVLTLGLWSLVAMNSPFWLAVGKALVQIGLEYGIVLERWLPVYFDGLLYRLEHRYIPRIRYIISWIPILNRVLLSSAPSSHPGPESQNVGQSAADKGQGYERL